MNTNFRFNENQKISKNLPSRVKVSKTLTEKNETSKNTGNNIVYNKAITNNTKSIVDNPISKANNNLINFENENKFGNNLVNEKIKNEFDQKINTSSGIVSDLKTEISLLKLVNQNEINLATE